MATLSDFLTGLFVSDEDVATRHEVATGQQAILDRQRDQGLVDSDEYYGMTQEISDVATEEQRLQETTLISTVPWWVWPLAALGVFLYFGGGVWLVKKMKRKAA